MAGNTPVTSFFSAAPRVNLTQVITVTPVITAGAYTSGYQVGGIINLTNAVRQNLSGFGQGELVGVTILDGDNQNSPFDIWFFNSLPTITSTDHTPFAITTANLKATGIGDIQAGVLYSSSASGNSVSTTVNINFPFQIPATSTTPNSLYAVIITRGSPTYTTTSSLVFQFSVFMD